MAEQTTERMDSLLGRINIRPLVKSDLPALEWDGEFRHFRRLYAEIYESAESGKAALWIAEVIETPEANASISPEAKLIGQVFVQLISGRPELADGVYRAYVYGFRIRPAYRNRGLGTRMMQVVEDNLIEQGFRWVTLNVAQENPGALRLYERLGYKVVAPEPGRWSFIDDKGVRQEVHEPSWRMEKRLVFR